MNYDKLLSENFNNAESLNAQRAGYLGLNPFVNHQAMNKYPTPYQFPSSSSVGVNPYMLSDPNSNGYGLKFASEPVYHSAVETQGHYGPPLIMQSKGGKLKGAALSALTLLAFLFFLNLLQSCLKDQMDTMNPTVMVMSAGQRTYLLNRSDGKADDLNNNLDSLTSDEYKSDVGKAQRIEESEDYEQLSEQLEEEEEPVIRKKTKSKVKRIKSKKQQPQVSTIESRLQNLSKRLHESSNNS